MTDVRNGAYSKALVTYVDILGFADLINASRRDPSKIGRIERLLTTIKEELSTGGRVHRGIDGRKEKIFDSFNFSDLTVRSTRIPQGANTGEFIDWELFYLAGKQISLALDRVLVRGGICIGDVFVLRDSAIAFGPAIVKSYKLESQYAVYPRIIIDRELIWKAGWLLCQLRGLRSTRRGWRVLPGLPVRSSPNRVHDSG